jgi:hypothetical protein
MRIHRLSLWSAVAVLGLLASLACANRAQADVLTVGGTYNTFGWTLTEGGNVIAQNEGGGSINVSVLNGNNLPWLYCIDIPDNISPNATYNNTLVTTTGQAIYGAQNPWPGVPGLTFAGGDSGTIASEIAWVLANNAIAGNTPAQQEAIQAAIWSLIYGQASSPSANGYYITDPGVRAAVFGSGGILASGPGTSSPSGFLWLSPGKTTDPPGTIYQALVTVGISTRSITPEPSSFAIAGLGALAFLGYGLRRRKAQGA